MMDIASLSMSVANNRLGSTVGTAVLGKSLDMAEKMGQGVVNMMNSSAMELSVNPSVGSNLDIRL